MKTSLVIGSALFALFATSGAMSSAAYAAPALECHVNPAGTAKNCSTNKPNPTYAASFVVTGLAPGSYAYEWSNAIFDGRFPSVNDCTGASCTQEFSSRGDHDEDVTVVITNLKTLEKETLTVGLSAMAVCGTHFC